MKNSDVTFAFKAVGVVFLVFIAVSCLFLEQCPEGYKPAGWEPAAQAGGAAPKNLDWKGMLSTPVFYVMLLLLTCGAFSGMMVISQAKPVANLLIGEASAALAVSVLALFNAFGRIVAGTLSDKIGRINTLCLACVLGAAGLICLYFTGVGSTAQFFVGLSVVGISFGSFMGVYPGFTADQFGPKNNSVNYGIMFIGFALAGYFGPQIMAKTVASTGTYQQAFLIAACISVAGVVFTFLYRVLGKKSK
jgi:MFS family permease